MSQTIELYNAGDIRNLNAVAANELITLLVGDYGRVVVGGRTYQPSHGMVTLEQTAAISIIDSFNAHLGDFARVNPLSDPTQQADDLMGALRGDDEGFDE